MTQEISTYNSTEGFELAQREAKLLSGSDLTPAAFKNNIGNTMIAMEMANRMNLNPMIVMQNIHIIQGNPTWKSKFVIAILNSCGKFSQLRFKREGEPNTDNRSCIAFATDLTTGELLEGIECNVAMAKAEGWYDRKGSKWPSMPEVMLAYRAATFFGSLHAPELMMGMSSDQAPMNHVTEDVNHEELLSRVNSKKTIIIPVTEAS